LLAEHVDSGLPVRGLSCLYKGFKIMCKETKHVSLYLLSLALTEVENNSTWHMVRVNFTLQELHKKVRGVLNKLTPKKFHRLVSQVQVLPIDSIDRLKGVINLVFEKVRQPSVVASTLKYRCHIDKNVLFLTLLQNFLVVGSLCT
jgi:hypothetical protein